MRKILEQDELDCIKKYACEHKLDDLNLDFIKKYFYIDTDIASLKKQLWVNRNAAYDYFYENYLPLNNIVAKNDVSLSVCVNRLVFIKEIFSCIYIYYNDIKIACEQIKPLFIKFCELYISNLPKSFLMDFLKTAKMQAEDEYFLIEQLIKRASNI